MNMIEVSNGRGQLLPHTIRRLDDFGMPTPLVVAIANFQDLADNLTGANPVLPVPQFDTQAVLPSGAPGNHFLYVRFSQPLDIDTVLDGSSSGASNSGLTGSVLVSALDPISGDSFPIMGRAFVNGQTYVASASGTELQTWVTRDPNGRPTVFELDEDGNQVPLQAGNPGLGFPGTEGDFNGSTDLISPNVLVFVPDSDGSLALHDVFPSDVQVNMRVTTAVRAENGNQLPGSLLASTTVGPDRLRPEILVTPGSLSEPLITPGGGDTQVDPLTTIRVEFTEPVQPLTVGDLQDGSPPTLSPSVRVSFGPPASRTDMPFAVRPVSIFDLSVYELFPIFNFPGSAPTFGDCVAEISTIDIVVNPDTIEDLAQVPNPSNPTDPALFEGNKNSLNAQTFFMTGEGPGVVNAPVQPDTILVGRSGAVPGISVVDLNGFGASTGNPEFDMDFRIEGNTNFPNNPNVLLQNGLLPPLSAGNCTIDGGSAGVFTLTLDSSLNDLLVRPPLLANVSDMMSGQALDAVFNNALFPFGCQALGGQICSVDGLKAISANESGPNTAGPTNVAAGTLGTGVAVGLPNVISWAPHPNPPPIVFPPLCVSPFLNAQEPTSVDHSTGNFVMNVNPALPNLLGPGDPFGTPNTDPPIPPDGLLTMEQNVFFNGPSQGQIMLSSCNTYSMRQQIGHFLYTVDRQRREVSVFNSNRMTVVERIPVPDPTSLAMGTNLDFLAVSNQAANTVSFIDIDPNSSTFHQVVQNVVVGDGPRGIAWHPGNEDILVCNEGDSSMSIISAFSLQVRRVISSQLSQPFEVCVFPRMANFAFLRNVYYAYIVNRSGTIAMFESGPNGVNGWGFDDIIGIAPSQFLNPKTIQPDPINLQVAAWIVHEGPIDQISGQAGPTGEGAVSLLFVESAAGGQLALGGGNANPQFRSLQLAIQVSFGNEKLSGVPVDLAFDNLRNTGVYPNPVTDFSAGAPAPVNSKNLIRTGAAGVFGGGQGFAAQNTNEPAYLFVAVPNASGGSGVIDVFEVAAAGVPRVDTNVFQPGVQSIPSPNVVVLSDYYRQ